MCRIFSSRVFLSLSFSTIFLLFSFGHDLELTQKKEIEMEVMGTQLTKKTVFDVSLPVDQMVQHTQQSHAL